MKKISIEKLLLFPAVIVTACLSICISACGEDLAFYNENKESSGEIVSYHLHLYDEWVTVKRPTCTEDGERERYCSCGEKQTSVIASLGHEYIYHEGKAATCTQAGWTDYRTCANCDYSDYKEIPALGHEFGEWEITKEPKCNENGEETRVCLLDGAHTETREIQSLGHTHSEWQLVTKPTCEESGLQIKYCVDCEELIETQEIPELGHNFGEWIEITAPTCTQDGLRTRTCLHDSEHVETEIIKAIGHAYEWEYDENSHYAVCGECGDRLENSPHEWDGNVCAVCGYEKQIPELSFESNGGSSFTVTGTGTVTQSEIIIPSTYKGLPVTAISAYAFSGCEFITYIEIPSSVTSIGEGAFLGCSSLESLSIPFVGTKADGTGYRHFGIIFGAETLDDNGDFVPQSLRRVKISGSITEICDGAFSGCTNLITVELPESIISIGNEAFYGCSQLKSLVIPLSTESIGTYALSGCTSLESVEFENKDGWQIYLNGKNYGTIPVSKLENAVQAVL